MIRSRLTGALGVTILMVAVAACGSSNTGGGGGGGGGGGDNTPAALTIKVLPDPTNVGKFEANPSTAKVNDTVKWSFDDADNQHTVTAEDSSFDSGNKSKGETFTFKFTKAGTFAYHCLLHANMKGTITIT